MMLKRKEQNPLPASGIMNKMLPAQVIEMHQLMLKKRLV